MNNIQDRIIALAVIASTLGLGFVLLSGIGDYQLEGDTREITIDFDRIDNVKARVTEIKMAGMPIGVVSDVRILTRQERAGLREAMIAKDPSATNSPPPSIRVTGDIDPSVVLSAETVASVRQASLMSEQYVELSAGPPDSDPLPPGSIIAGTSGKGMDDLMDPAAKLLSNLRDAVADVKLITGGLGERLPNVLKDVETILSEVKTLTASIKVKIPASVDRLDAVLDNAKTFTGDLSSEKSRGKIQATLDNAKTFTGDLSSPESRERLRAIFDNAKSVTADLKVVSQNLKVVSTHAKLITGTLGQRPWRVLFGGKDAVNELPDEQRILASDKPIPVKPAETSERKPAPRSAPKAAPKSPAKKR